MKAGVARAAEAINSGAAKAVLAALVAITNRKPAGE
jgi:anthranilate phosphoribosyltransferase